MIRIQHAARGGAAIHRAHRVPNSAPPGLPHHARQCTEGRRGSAGGHHQPGGLPPAENPSGSNSVATPDCRGHQHGGESPYSRKTATARNAEGRSPVVVDLDFVSASTANGKNTTQIEGELSIRRCVELGAADLRQPQVDQSCIMLLPPPGRSGGQQVTAAICGRQTAATTSGTDGFAVVPAT